jgi:site-specific DNA-methyltransferase (adenine-specific)
MNQIKMLSVDKIIPYENNPRINTEAVQVVKQSIARYGFNNPIIVDTNMVVIAGHTRLIAAKELGLEQVPVIIAEHLSEKEAKAYRIMDNKSSEYADWSFDRLKNELESLDDLKTEVGFSDEELEEILAEALPEQQITEEPELPDEPFTQRGDIWVLGNQYLLCGDSTNREEYMGKVKELSSNNADHALGAFKGQVHAIITDPPYNVALNKGSQADLKRRKRRTNGVQLENDAMSQGEFENFLKKVFKIMIDYSQAGSPVYIFYGDKNKLIFQRAFEEVGYHYHQDIVWDKSRLIMGNYDYQSTHESIIYGWKAGANRRWYSDRKQSSVVRFERPNKSDVHLSTKPTELLKYLMGNSTKAGQWLFEPFAGSGSLMIAAEAMGRKSINVELSPIYADRIVMNFKNNFMGSVDKIRLLRMDKTYDWYAAQELWAEHVQRSGSDV